MEVAGQSQQDDPRPQQRQPLKGSHSVVMSQDWHPSSNRVAESGFIGKSEEEGKMKRKCEKEEASKEEGNKGGVGEEEKKGGARISGQRKRKRLDLS